VLAVYLFGPKLVPLLVHKCQHESQDVQEIVMLCCWKT